MVQGGEAKKFLLPPTPRRAYALTLPVATPLVQSPGAGAKPL